MKKSAFCRETVSTRNAHVIIVGSHVLLVNNSDSLEAK